MSLLTPEGESEPTTGAISRRRVLAGTAWATPVVLLAVATPPAAASDGGNAGAIVNYQAPQVRLANYPVDGVYLQLGAIQQAQGANLSPAVVTSLTMQVLVDGTLTSLDTGDMVAAKAQITLDQSAGWVVEQPSYAPATHTWTLRFLWGGGDIGRNDQTTGLNVEVPTAESPGGGITVSAYGMSDGIAVNASFPGGNTAHL